MSHLGVRELPGTSHLSSKNIPSDTKKDLAGMSQTRTLLGGLTSHVEQRKEIFGMFQKGARRSFSGHVWLMLVVIAQHSIAMELFLHSSAQLELCKTLQNHFIGRISYITEISGKIKQHLSLKGTPSINQGFICFNTRLGLHQAKSSCVLLEGAWRPFRTAVCSQ